MFVLKQIFDINSVKKLQCTYILFYFCGSLLYAVIMMAS